jgi:hypothetical protein
VKRRAEQILAQLRTHDAWLAADDDDLPTMALVCSGPGHIWLRTDWDEVGPSVITVFGAEIGGRGARDPRLVSDRADDARFFPVGEVLFARDGNPARAFFFS